MLPKFDPNEKILVDDHLQSFYLEIEGLRDGEHEDVVCRIFPHTLKGAATSWYFGLPTNSIPDWDTFERIFRSKYAIQKMHATLMKGLCPLKKERKEKVHSFTQRFAAYLKKNSETDKPSDKVLIEYYLEQSGEKGAGRKVLLFTKPKEEKSPDFENMAKMMQKLSNKIIDRRKKRKHKSSISPIIRKKRITISLSLSLNLLDESNRGRNGKILHFPPTTTL